MRRIAVYVIILILLMPSQVVGATGEDIFEEGGYVYRDIGNGEAEIVRYIGEEREIVIPRELGGLTVTSIGNESFKEKDLINVNFPDTIKKIGHSAFRKNRIEEIRLPNYVEEMGTEIMGDGNTKKVVIPRTVTKIDDNVFYHGVLEEVVFEGRVDLIGRGAFQGNNIKRVELPEGVGKIDLFAFRGNNIEEVKILGDVGVVGLQSFGENKVSRFIVDGDVETFELGVFDGRSVEKRIEIFIKGDIEKIGDFAFTRELHDAVFRVGGTIDEIGEFAFSKNNIKEFYVEKGINKIGGFSFSENLGGTDFRVGGNVGSLGEFAFMDSYIKNFYVEGDINKIEQFAFYDTGNFLREEAITTQKKIEIGGRVDKVERFAFSYLNNMVLDIRGGIRELGEFVFTESRWEHIDVFRDVEVIGYQIFTHAEINEDIKIPNTVQRWDTGGVDEGYTFLQAAVQGVEIEEGIKYLPPAIFLGSTIKKIKIPKSVEYIGRLAFGESSLEETDIEGGVQEIGAYAFKDSTLKCITIPDSVVKIGEKAFLKTEGKSEEFKIFGGVGTKAERYAKENGHVFIENTIEKNTCNPIEWEVIVEYVDKSGNVLEKEVNKKPPLGNFIVEAKELVGYKLIGESRKTVQITNEEHTHKLTFEYEELYGGVKVSYVDEQGRELKESENIRYKIKDGDRYKIIYEDIKGYELKEVIGEEEGELLEGETIEVIYIYQEITDKIEEVEEENKEEGGNREEKRDKEKVKEDKVRNTKEEVIGDNKNEGVGGELPKTATNYYNMLYIGVIMVVSIYVTKFLRRKVEGNIK